MFLTPIYVGEYEAADSILTFKARGWTAEFRRRSSREAQHEGLQLHLHASNDETAQRGLDAIWAAHGLLAFEGGDDQYLRVYQAGVKYRTGIDIRATAANTAYFPRDILRACSLAAKASRRRDHQYALAISHVSRTLHVNYPIQLDPASAQHIPLSINPGDHARFAYAIVSSYAIIEQLGLEVRASGKKHSFIKGSWNPPVREDLEHRLMRAGIDLSESVAWCLRGPRTRVESARGIRALRRANWAWGTVRDIEVDVVDAIAGVSWLRSRVSAHRIGELARSLSIYDVANAQILARRLLLEVLGMYSRPAIQPEQTNER